VEKSLAVDGAEGTIAYRNLVIEHSDSVLSAAIDFCAPDITLSPIMSKEFC